jgi:hypothetical protein
MTTTAGLGLCNGKIAWRIEIPFGMLTSGKTKVAVVAAELGMDRAFQGRRVEISSDPPEPIQIDGDVAGTGPFTVDTRTMTGSAPTRRVRWLLTRRVPDSLAVFVLVMALAPSVLRKRTCFCEYAIRIARRGTGHIGNSA